MASKVKRIFKIFLLSSSLCIQGESKLPILSTKQDISNLRFISSDGKFTYYQKSSGSFLLSTNYKVKESIKLSQNTHFQVKTSQARKWVIVSANEDYQTYYSPQSLWKIYKIPFGKSQSKFIGKGLAPLLHLNDEWISWFNPFERKIHFINLNKEALKFSIPTANIKNPYFIPEVIMLDNNRILFTDINKKGFPGILLFEINSRKITLFQKFETPNIKLEICRKNKHIYVARYGFDNIEQASVIRQIKSSSLDYTKSKLVYQSNKNDIGQMICHISDDFIYFIKNISNSNGKIIYEVAQLNTTNKQVKIISDISFATQLLEMDGHLLLPYNGSYRVLLGENNMTQFDLLKKKNNKLRMKKGQEKK